MYPEHYKIFSKNVESTARALHYIINIDRAINEDDGCLKVLNADYLFWSDFGRIAMCAVFINLGKIFGDDTRGKGEVYNFKKLIKSAYLDLSYFNKNALRNRKMKLGMGDVLLEEVLGRAYELSPDDFKSIKAYSKRAYEIWAKLKPVRDKFYAHEQIMSDDEKNMILEVVSSGDLMEIMQILTNISNALQEAEQNGRKPDFSQNYSYPMNEAKRVIYDLFNRLKKGSAITERAGNSTLYVNANGTGLADITADITNS